MRNKGFYNTKRNNISNKHSQYYHTIKYKDTQNTKKETQSTFKKQNINCQTSNKIILYTPNGI